MFMILSEQKTAIDPRDPWNRNTNRVVMARRSSECSIAPSVHRISPGVVTTHHLESCKGFTRVWRKGFEIQTSCHKLGRTIQPKKSETVSPCIFLGDFSLLLAYALMAVCQLQIDSCRYPMPIMISARLMYGGVDQKKRRTLKLACNYGCFEVEIWDIM
ncbi:hypothetical protein VTN77DRAFT_4217 [Rasamsonia byssochlamydoides]|uniref:uncharacterized protein n=1 Tax=Rasamsonia byssochlamydoides TaxID=89139 RepID=UPI003743D3CF